MNDQLEPTASAFLESAAKLQRLAIDTSDIETAATVIAGVRDVYETIPQEIRLLRQFAPVVAIYQSKLASLQNRLFDAFDSVIEISEEGHFVHVHHELYDVDKLWASAITLGFNTALSRQLSLRFSKTVFKVLMAHNDSLGCEIEGSVWRLKTGTYGSISGSVPETISKFFSFIKSEVFDATAPEHLLYERFLRACWGLLSRQLAKKFTDLPPGEQFCVLEESILGQFSSDPPQAILTLARNQWLDQESARRFNATLELIRKRILADIVNKVTRTPPPPNQDMIDELGFYPNLVSETCLWIVDNCLGTPSDTPAIIALFLLMRRPEFSDPSALNGRNLGIFFQDCSYFCLKIALMASNAGEADARVLRDQIAIVRSCVVTSVEFFTRKMMGRFKSRIESCKSFNLGLVTTDQESAADECIEQCLVELANCSREWNMEVKLSKQVANLWTVTLADMLLKYMNNVAQNTATVASVSNAPSALWGVWSRFVGSVEMLGNLSCFNSYKAAKKIELALSGTVADINAVRDPIADDEQVFGVTYVGFEKLLASNPLLKGESRNVLNSLVGKLVIQVNPNRSKEVESNSTRSYASLFG